MPFCRECGGQVETTWKFCPHCNSSLQTASVSVQDGVIAGDVTITQNQIDTSGIKLECPTCKVEGNIKLHLCKLVGCESKACEECISKNSGFCSRKCSQTNHDIEWERARPEREAKKDAERRAEREKQAKRERFAKNEEIVKEKREKRLPYVYLLFWLGLTIVIFSGVKLYGALEDIQCNDGEWISNIQILDGVEDCNDGSDEIDNLQNRDIKESLDSNNYWEWSLIFGLLAIGVSFWNILLYVFDEISLFHDYDN